MQIREIPEDDWFHDPWLRLEGKVVRHGEGGTVVKMYRPRDIVIRGKCVGRVSFTAPEHRTSAWEVEPGRLPERSVAV